MCLTENSTLECAGSTSHVPAGTSVVVRVVVKTHLLTKRDTTRGSLSHRSYAARAHTRTPDSGGRLEIHLEVDVDDVAVPADGVRVVGVPDRRFVDVHQLRIQADAALFQEIPV